MEDIFLVDIIKNNQRGCTAVLKKWPRDDLIEIFRDDFSTKITCRGMCQVIWVTPKL